jgi:hypothetical protein
MREKFPPGLAIWVILVVVLCLHGTYAAPIVKDLDISPLDFQGTVNWLWELNESQPEGTVLTIFSKPNAYWSGPNWIPGSTPDGWVFHSDFYGTGKEEGRKKLEWIAVEDENGIIGASGLFTVTPDGPVVDSKGGWELNLNPLVGEGDLEHVPMAVVPEAGTWSLLGLGLLAGALFRWRKKAKRD